MLNKTFFFVLQAWVPFVSPERIQSTFIINHLSRKCTVKIYFIYNGLRWNFACKTHRTQTKQMWNKFSKITTTTLWNYYKTTKEMRRVSHATNEKDKLWNIFTYKVHFMLGQFCSAWYLIKSVFWHRFCDSKYSQNLMDLLETVCACQISLFFLLFGF